MNFTAAAIAEFLKGRVEGDPEAAIHDVSKIEEGRPGTLSFLANPKYEKYIYETRSSIVIVNDDFEASAGIEATLIRVPNAYEAFAALLRLYEEHKPKKQGIHKLASIPEGCQLGKDLYIGEYTVIGENVKLGDGVRLYPQVYIGDGVSIGTATVIYPGAKIYEGCEIGANCVIHAGAVIGADGFGFAPNQDNNYEKVPQIGKVVLEDFVEIGANTTVDRATMGATLIKKGVKLDNLVMIAHNVEVGENTVMAAQTGISGSTKIGPDCMFGGQVGIVGHITIARGVKIGAQSGVNKPIRKENQVVQGTPVLDYSNFRRSSVVFRNLPQLRDQVLELEQKVSYLAAAKSAQ
ncbi:MAG: UDP-3-O-(3-hydroxymyristoyl)glucosamine N-acyltransferase [Bacteroidetes bacterium]|nr:MAG: UDP-3-O-(3-hydroxymyristoyl)glucosamine N-acyltransferase [Bacteroidota bacterium]